MRILVYCLLLPFFSIAQSIGLETLIGKPISSPEFVQLQQQTQMEELTMEQRKIGGKVIEQHWIFKGPDYHGRVKAATQGGGEMVVAELSFYRPSKQSPKVKGKATNAPLPLGMSWDMTEPQLRQKIGNSRDAWVRYNGYELQCVGFTENSDFKMNRFYIRQAVQYTYTPPPVTTSSGYYPPPTMVKIINNMQASGWYEHTRKLVPFPPKKAGEMTTVEIPISSPERWQGNVYYVTTEHTLGGYVFVVEKDGKLTELKPVPGNDSFNLYDAGKAIKGGRTFTIRVMSDGTNERSTIVVYGFGKN